MTAADSPMAWTPDRVSRALDQILGLVATAERLSRDRQVVNIAHLESRVAEVCHAISELPAAEARRFAGHLDALVAGLDRLERIARDAHQVMMASRGVDADDPCAAQPHPGPRASTAYAQVQAIIGDPAASRSSTPGDDDGL